MKMRREHLLRHFIWTLDRTCLWILGGGLVMRDRMLNAALTVLLSELVKSFLSIALYLCPSILHSLTILYILHTLSCCIYRSLLWICMLLALVFSRFASLMLAIFLQNIFLVQSLGIESSKVGCAVNLTGWRLMEVFITKQLTWPVESPFI